MGKVYDYKPSYDDTPYLTSEGSDYQYSALQYLDQAIDFMEQAAEELANLKGLGAEFLIDRLKDDLEKYRNVRKALKYLD